MNCICNRYNLKCLMFESRKTHALGAQGVYMKSDKPPHLAPKISAKTKRPLLIPQSHQAVFIIIT
nr:MAG TPA: hypothetical protein [Caudoviricetes sp.]